ncbi:MULTISPECIES: hypothetical protein [Spirosoma]|uniref:Uncharacterized protein n=1 Tax=Spirosoma liriopis TaxID=2937440 RepID=A0ABT0HV80_9BACT|nr:MULTISPECIES: hypothetical protein [Spirosoma]MCK8496109.1 hypothetical protein [Spirosoma liriopis]UHG94850.1 hypothetical protein LQ777_29465 [Spirosoma oryzicola]
MATTLPPVRKKPAEADIDAFINKGGSPTKKAEKEPKSKETEKATEGDNTVKFFNLRLTAGVLNRITSFREKRPRKLASPKLGISTHDWILEAIEEKMQREAKKYSM